MNDLVPTPPLRGDNPKQKIVEDDFGLNRIVGALADTLSTRVSPNGYILGIEGAWGSGKSSLTNFLVNELVDSSTHHRVVRFEPWLVGSKYSLLPEFFSLFSKRIDEWGRSNFAGWDSIGKSPERKYRKIVEKLREYGVRASSVSDATISVAAFDPTGSALIAAKLLKALGFLARLIKPATPSLEQLKLEIIDDLRLFGELRPNARFFVVVDDLDRLEPDEAIEVLRLVRKVADFPLIVYLLCFDRQILSQHINKSLGVGGDEFIEKIFQGIVGVPPQEPFALRRYFQKLLSESFPADVSRTDPVHSELETRKQFLFDAWAGRLLHTPRDAVRIADAILFGWPHISERADFFDYVWLQLIKLKEPSLYRWVQNYVRETGAYRDGGSVDNATAKKQADELAKILEGLGWVGDQIFRSGIDTFLPGLKKFSFEKGSAGVFKFESEDLAVLEEGKRLGSPSHWRHYFAFDKPSYAIDDDEIAAFRKAIVTDNLQAIRLMREMFAKPANVRGYFARVLLDRLASLPKGSLAVDELNGLAQTFAAVMDDAAHRRLKDEFGGTAIWQLAEKILRRSDPGKLAHLIQHGQAVNWFALVIRREEVARNRQEAWLSQEQYQASLKALISRFRLLDAEIFRTPEPLQILFCWLQLGDANEVQAFIARTTQNNESFLYCLDSLRSWVNGSDRGVYFPLYRKFVAHFMNAESALGRLKHLASFDFSDVKVRSMAIELLEAWSDENLPD